MVNISISSVGPSKDEITAIKSAIEQAQQAIESINTTLDELESSLFDGSYNSLSDVPESFPSTWNQVSGKPSSFPTKWADIADAPELPEDSIGEITGIKSRLSTLEDGMSRVYRPCGSVNNVSDLTSKEATAQVGDVYNVVNDNGNNYVWLGSDEGWDALGSVYDLSKYITDETFNSAVSTLNGSINTVKSEAANTYLPKSDFTGQNILGAIQDDLDDTYLAQDDFTREAVLELIADDIKVADVYSTYKTTLSQSAWKASTSKSGLMQYDIALSSLNMTDDPADSTDFELYLSPESDLIEALAFSDAGLIMGDQTEGSLTIYAFDAPRCDVKVILKRYH